VPRSPDRPTVPVEALAELGLTEDLVIGEAVVLDLRPASFATRALALLLDVTVQGIVLFGLLLLLSLGLVALDEAAGAAAFLVIVVGVLVGLPVTVETLTRGRSLGKFTAGLRVVREDGGPIRFRQAFVRGLLGVFEIYLTTGTVALIASLSNARGRRLGDMLAGTYVIRERAGGPVGTPIVMPPELAGWARGADLGRLPDSLALAVRQFLRRATTLHPASRQRLGMELAGRTAVYVAPPPPAGTGPESFLAAVLFERHERDLARLATERAAREAREHRRSGSSVLAPGSTMLVGAPDGTSSARATDRPSS
jgi:uncharacterized RDD family membrane protein YckC